MDKSILKKSSEVNPFCCIAFNRHSLSKRASPIFSVPFRCTIAGCTTKGDISLYPDMKLVIKHSTNLFSIEKTNMIKLNHAKLKVPTEKRSKRLYLTALSQAKNITKILANLTIAILVRVIFAILETVKKVYKQIKHECLKTKQKHENTILSILKLKEEYLREFECQKQRGLFNTLVQSRLSLVFGLRKTLTFFMKV